MHLEGWHDLEGDALPFIEVFWVKGKHEQRGIVLDEFKQAR